MNTKVPYLLALLSSAALPWASLHAQQTKESNVDVNITVKDDDNGTTRRMFKFKSSAGDLWSKIEKQLEQSGLDEEALEKIEKAVEKAAESIESRAAILGSGLIINEDGTQEAINWANELAGGKSLESAGEWFRQAFPKGGFAAAKGLEDVFIHTNRSGHMIGVQCKPIDDAMRTQLKLDDGSGLLVQRVFDDTPAKAAGVMKHDILLKANDKPLQKVEELIEIIEGAGEEITPVTLTLLRRGEQESVTVNPEKRAKRAEVSTKEFMSNILKQHTDDSAIEKLQDQIDSLTKIVEDLRDKVDN